MKQKWSEREREEESIIMTGNTFKSSLNEGLKFEYIGNIIQICHQHSEKNTDLYFVCFDYLALINSIGKAHFVKKTNKISSNNQGLCSCR